MQSPETINRDVGEQSKGPRLQRLRAIDLILDAVNRPENVVAYCAVELNADVYLKEVSEDGTKEYHEEDKNYSEEIRFTFSSPQVLNTLVIFIDCWIKNGFSPNVVFGFYTPNDIAKERISPRSKSLQITWPDVPVLEVLTQGTLDDDDTLKCICSILEDEYKKQYPDENGKENGDHARRGNLSVLQAWKAEEWKGFFAQIRWKFGMEDDKELESSLISKIQKFRHYNHSLAGKEPLIISALCDLLDKKQSIPDLVERQVHSAEVTVVFRDVGSGAIRLPDPSFQTWLELPPPTDTRNLKDKVTQACPAASEKELGRWSRWVANSLNSERALSEDKSYYSVMYHVHDVSEEIFDRLTRANGDREVTSEMLNEWVRLAVQDSQRRLDDCRRDFTYVATNQTFLTEMVWGLVDSCYLAFDSEAS